MGSASERLARLLVLVPWLSAHDGITIDDAAAHFHVSPRELEDDLNLLICSGLPGYSHLELVDIQFWGEGAAIHVIDPQTLEHPLRLNADEAMALLVGLRMLEQVPGDHDRSALAETIAILERVAGEAATGSDQVVVAIAAPDDTAASVDRALSLSRAMRITYANGGRDAVSTRTIDPVRTIVDGGHAYLEAWCRSAEGTRLFRLDRIMSAEVLEEPSNPVPTSESSETTLDPNSALRSTGERVRLHLAPGRLADLERIPLTVVEEDPDGSALVDMDVAERDWLIRLVLSMGGGATIVAPEVLAQAVRDEAQRALNAYS